MKREKTFCLNCEHIGSFNQIKSYLVKKYTVYTASFEHGIGRFRVEY